MLVYTFYALLSLLAVVAGAVIALILFVPPTEEQLEEDSFEEHADQAMDLANSWDK